MITMIVTVAVGLFCWLLVGMILLSLVDQSDKRNNRQTTISVTKAYGVAWLWPVLIWVYVRDIRKP
jgi:uncharacterized protein with PQ loop repeat